MKPNNLLINMVKNYNSYVECWKKSLAASNFTFSARPRHREHDGVFKSNFDAQNPCSWQKKKEKYSRLHLLLTGLHLWSEIFVRSWFLNLLKEWLATGSFLPFDLEEIWNQFFKYLLLKDSESGWAFKYFQSLANSVVMDNCRTVTCDTRSIQL